MNEETAKILNDEIAENDNDLLRYDSKISREKVKWINRFLGKYLEKGKTIIELGRGSGKQLFEIEKLGLETIGLDISKGMIKRFNENKINNKSNAKIIEGSYFNIPLGKNSVDYALFVKNIIECSYEEFEIVCAEVNRILNVNGKFIIAMINGNKNNLNNYDIFGDNYNSVINIPAKNEMLYPIYYWTIDFANYVLSKEFILENRDMETDEKGTVLLVYKRKNCRI